MKERMSFLRAILSIAIFAAFSIPVVGGDIATVLAPAGTFLMGDPWSEGNSDERPVHSVTFPYAYWIGEREVTNLEFANRLNWVFSNPTLVPSAERITNSSGGAYSGGAVYVNNRLAIDVSDSIDWCQIDFSGGDFAVATRDSLSMDNHPAAMVTFYGAEAFCNWQSRFEGLVPVYDIASFEMNPSSSLSLNPSSALGYRLPTEAEWERAAAWDPTHHDSVASGHWRYGFTADAIDLSRANYYDSGSSVYNNPQGLTAQPFTSDVGFFDGSNSGVYENTLLSKGYYGCYDMSGNVYEWCQDNYHSTYTGAPTDGNAWETSVGATHVVRGGAWNTRDKYCRSAYRGLSNPTIRAFNIGFRVAQSPAVAWATPTPSPTSLPTSNATNWMMFE